jgi:hypothetical protein
MKKILFLILVLSISVLAQAPKNFKSQDRDCPAPRALKINESPAITLELRDHKKVGRKLLIFDNGRYQFFPAPGTRPATGTIEYEKTGDDCLIKFTDVEEGHTLQVLANSCRSTGTATLFSVGEPVHLNDKTAEVQPKK